MLRKNVALSILLLVFLRAALPTLARDFLSSGDALDVAGLHRVCLLDVSRHPTIVCNPPSCALDYIDSVSACNESFSLESIKKRPIRQPSVNLLHKYSTLYVDHLC